MASKSKNRRTILIQQQWKYRLSNWLYLGSIPGYSICDGFLITKSGRWVSSGCSGFFPQKLWKRNESLFNKYYFFTWSLLFLCFINFVLILLLLCDLVLFCTYVSGFGFNMTMVELIESVLNHKLVFIMETLLYMYVWSCGDLFWYTFDSEIFINWTNQ